LIREDVDCGYERLRRESERPSVDDDGVGVEVEV
jgi:hypothetical protein